MRKISFLVFLLLATVWGKAQQTIGLEQIIEEIKSNNPNLKVQQLDTEVSQMDLLKIKSAFLPQIELSYTGINTNSPMNAFGFKLMQERISQTDFSPELLNNPDPIFDFNTQLSVQQPLLNFDVYAMKKAAETTVEAKKWQSKRMEQAMIFEAQKAYADLQFLYEAQKVNQAAIAAYSENERVVNNLLNQGLINKTELLNIQIEVKNIENQSINLEVNIKNISDYLSYLMGRPLEKVYQPQENILQKKQTSLALLPIEERADFKAMETAIEARRLMKEAENKKFLPRLNAFGEFKFNDKHPLGFGANSYMVGAKISWSFFDGNQSKYQKNKINAEIAKAEAEIEQKKLENQLKIEKAEREIASSLLKIQLADLAIEQAQEARKITNNRYRQGLEKMADVMVAETQFVEKKLNKINAVKEYNQAVYLLEFLTKIESL